MANKGTAINMLIRGVMKADQSGADVVQATWEGMVSDPDGTTIVDKEKKPVRADFIWDGSKTGTVLFDKCVAEFKKQGKIS